MLEMIWIGMLIAGAVLFVAALFMALYWRVFDIFDELSGRKAQRYIKKMREAKAITGSFSEQTTGGYSGTGGLATTGSITSNHSTGYERSLRDRIDDPYGSVGKNAKTHEIPAPIVDDKSIVSGAKVVEVVPDEEAATGMFDEPMWLSTGNIVILEEQTSLSKEVL